jgi:uncharacterized protein YndB with AHSA1/START domain
MLLKLDGEIVVERPVNAVFQAFKEEMWDVLSLGVETEVQELTDGPISVGSSYLHITQHRSGRRIESKVKVEEYEQNQRVELSWSAGEPGHWTWQFGASGFANFGYSPAWGEEGSRLEVLFSEHDTGTQIRGTSEHHISGAAVPLSFIMRWPARRRIRKKLSRFKEALEGEARDTAASW